jgi:outer membrane biosynthesis protein TonB
MTFDGEPPLTLGDPGRRPAPPSPRRSRAGLLIGAAVVAALAVGAAVMARELLAEGPAGPDRQDGMDIVMGAPPPEPKLPPVGEKLETLSPEAAARAEPPPAEPALPPQPVPMDPPEPPVAPEPPPAPLAPAPPWAQAPRLPPQAPRPPRAPAPRETDRAMIPTVDCAAPGSLADEMTCADPALAAADRQMARAFRRAVRAGAPYGELRAEQNDFMAMREDAALRSPRALARLYDQRIDDLNAIADGDR